MKVTLPGRMLRDAVKAGMAVVKTTDDRQILRNLFLVATPDGLEITATDTITSLWLHLPASEMVKIDKPGRAVVNAENLQRLVNTVVHKDVTLVGAERNFQVRASGSRFKLNIEDANDFPRIARFSSRKPYITIKAGLLPKLVARTAYCASGEASFQLMHGMLMQAQKNELRMVATNGQRLAVSSLSFEQQSDPNTPFIAELVIPADAADTFKQIVNDDVETVDIQWMKNFINVRSNLGEVSIRALAGNYPVYTRGIPDDLKEITLDRKGIFEILRQTVAIKSPTTCFVALKILKDRMVFSSFAEGAGETEVEYEHAWDDDDHKLTVNPDFMLQTLGRTRGNDVRLEVGTEMTPTILREQDDKSEIKSFCVFAVVRQ